jgi:hypothetical protein
VTMKFRHLPLRSLLAGSVVLAVLLFTATAPTVAHASARGNQTKVQTYWWGWRFWINHTSTQNVIRSVQTTGSLSGVGNIPVSPQLKLAAKHIGCAGQFVQNLKRDDVGYGVVFDVPFYTPFWTCGLKVWSQ